MNGKTWRNTNGEICGVIRFTTAHPNIQKDDTITICNTDFDYDTGLECFSNEEQNYWYSCNVKLIDKYQDDYSRPAIGGTSGNYHYEQYIITGVNMHGEFITKDNREFLLLHPHKIEYVTEVAHIHGVSWEIDYNELNEHSENKYEFHWLHTTDELNTTAKLAYEDTSFGEVYYNNGFSIESWGEEEVVYNPYDGSSYKSYDSDFWENCDKAVEGEVLCVFLFNSFDNTYHLFF